MNLKDHLAGLSAESRHRLAIECGTSRGHLQNVAYGYRACSPALAAALEIATTQSVTRRDLRPDDWQAIWPELAEAA